MNADLLRIKILNNISDIMKREGLENLLVKAVEQTLEQIYDPLKRWEIINIDLEKSLIGINQNDWKFNLFVEDLAKNLSEKFEDEIEL